jgi:hypothetical protein
MRSKTSPWRSGLNTGRAGLLSTALMLPVHRAACFPNAFGPTGDVEVPAGSRASPLLSCRRLRFGREPIALVIRLKGCRSTATPAYRSLRQLLPVLCLLRDSAASKTWRPLLQ